LMPLGCMPASVPESRPRLGWPSISAPHRVMPGLARFRGLGPAHAPDAGDDDLQSATTSPLRLLSTPAATSSCNRTRRPNLSLIMKPVKTTSTMSLVCRPPAPRRSPTGGIELAVAGVHLHAIAPRVCSNGGRWPHPVQHRLNLRIGGRHAHRHGRQARENCRQCPPCRATHHRTLAGVGLSFPARRRMPSLRQGAQALNPREAPRPAGSQHREFRGMWILGIGELGRFITHHASTHVFWDFGGISWAGP
jgi:hypothetical protein